MKDVTLNQRAQTKLQVLNSVMEYQLPKIQAAELLGISDRQLRRVLAVYRRDGAAALAHGNRGRKPRNTVPEDVAGAAVVLASGKYAGFNHSHLTEVLAEREEIQLIGKSGNNRNGYLVRYIEPEGTAAEKRAHPPGYKTQ